MLVVCERWVGDGDRLLHIDPKVLLTIVALLLHSGWVAQPWVTEGRKPSVCRWLSLRHPVPNFHWNSNWHKPSVAPGYIFVWHSPASCGRTHLHRIQPRPQVKVIFWYLRQDAPVSLFFRLFTQEHLLIDGSVEGQYVTIGLYQVLPLWVRVDMGAMVMKRHFAFPKAPALEEPHHQIDVKESRSLYFRIYCFCVVVS